MAAKKSTQSKKTTRLRIQAAAKRKGAKKPAGKRTGVKRKGAKQPAGKRTVAKRTAAKRPAGKQTAAKRTAGKRTVVKRTSAKSAGKAGAKTTKATTTRRKASATSKAAKTQMTLERAALKRTVRRIVGKPPKAAAKKSTLLEDLPTEEIWAHYQRARRESDKAKQLERIRNLLMERHYPLVKYIAERLLQTLPKSIELDDLVSAGLFGLMDAIRGFDPSRGIKFKTYCTTRIRGSILDQLRSQDWVPRLVRLKAGRIDKALQRLTGEYGREPTHAELAATLEMDHAELTREISSANAKAMYSLSDKWEDRDDDSSMEKVDVLEDKKSTDPIGELNKLDMMNFITRSLTHKERFIIEQYYQVGHTMREIGEMLSLTESRVCQIHSNVMARLKSLFGQKQTTLLM